jgi:hypothetical protein
MKINKISKDLYEIENFVTSEQSDKILDFFSSLKEDDWFFEDSNNPNYKDELWYGRQYHGKRPEVFSEITESTEKLFSTLMEPVYLAIQRYKKNDAINEHRDYWLYDKPYHIRYGICIYYNDNYSGGELEYPELGIIHKPKARSLVIHGGNILHKSLPVTSEDIRYFSTGFIKGSKESPSALNKEIFADVYEEDGSTYA